MSNNCSTDLETFVQVVEAGSFTQAASRTGRSKAGVSRQVKRLEDRLGVRLLNRTTRSLSLTDPGTALYERCSTALAELREAEEAATLHQATPRGRLRASVPVAFGHRVVAPSLFRLIEEYPELELDLSFTDRYVDLVNEGFDLVVRIGELADSSLVARRLGQTRRIVCASPRYLNGHRPPEHPPDLLKHDCLLYSQQTAGSSWRFAGDVAINVRGRIRADSGDALLAAARAGLGIAWLPDFYVRDDLAEGRLVRCLEADEVDPLGIWVVYPHHRHLSLKVRIVVDHLARTITTSSSMPA
jgi:DNA-binding transcriptional LysR family regulator